tara:strand:- start:5082 stop:5699 length:618 start_codon:yes stop_codon:yes gene_type:complete
MGDVMKLNLVSIGACAALALSGFVGAAQADEGGFYVSVGGGLIWNDDVEAAGSTLDFDSGYSINAAIGYQTADDPDGGRIRGEIDVFYTDADNDTFTTGGVSTNVGGGLEQTGIMASGYLDFLPGSVVRPYVGAGFGIVDTKLSVSVPGFSASADGTELAYRLAAGASYQITDRVAFDLGYRYLVVNTDSEIDSQSVVASLRYGF